MDLVKAVILICAAGLPRSECQPESALAVMVRSEVTSPGLCGLHAQSLLSTSAFADELAEGAYIKVNCRIGEKAAKNSTRLVE